MGAAISPTARAGSPGSDPIASRPPRPLGDSDLTSDHWLVIGLAWTVVAALAVAQLLGVLPDGIAPLIGLVIAGLFGLAFLFRFWPTLVALLVMRPTLDIFKDPGASGGLDVTVLVGFIFLGAAAIWLTARAATGTFRKPGTPTLLFGAFVLAGAVASLGAAAPVVAMQSAVKLASAGLMLAVLEQILRDDPRRLRPVVIAALWSVAVPAFGGLYQYVQGPEQGDWVDLGRISSTFIHPNAFATYLMFMGLLAIAVRAALSGRMRVLAGAVALVTLPLLYFTLARSAWAGMIVGLVVIAWVLNRRLLWLLPVVLVVLLALPTTRARLGDLTQEDDPNMRGNANSLSWRVEYWGDITPMFEDSPLVGIGPDMVRETHPDHFEPHNTLLQSVVEFGLLGSALFISFFVSAIGALRRARRHAMSPLVGRVALGGLAMIAGYLVQAPVENVMFQVVLWWYLVIPVAAAAIVTASTSGSE